MTVAEVYTKECKKKKREIPFLAVLDTKTGKAPCDFVDEYLETHGDLEVANYQYVKKYDCIYIELK